QIVYPKDMGLIALKTGIGPGSKVVEAGAGSGALTMFLAHLVRPDGHVFTFEIRSEFLPIVERNLEKAGLSKYVTLKNLDAVEGLDVKSADVAIIDVGDPWSLVGPMNDALAGGGRIAALTPTMNQLERLVGELVRNNFKLIESMEVMVRGIEARPNKTRPEMRMIGHTAYITTARKALP
ncbi:MAG: tRNA (adenine-N1)-methyltransferase, partial [Nitrososphaerales archaeon]